MTRPARSLGRRVLVGALWTVALAGVLVGLDRGLLGPVEEPGWVVASGLDAVPERARPTVVPTYLPDVVAWPPARILYYGGDPSGWWLGLEAPEGGPPRLWLGSRWEDAAAAIGPAAACLLDTHGLCPPHWHVLSTEVRPGVAVVVLGDLSPLDLRRVVEGLRVDGEAP